ncbi:MAG TPA: hypothetical protein DCL35_03205 [Candidatus Omnitrophica bacterium]|nr:hypothetical protein [Candidatus Omnitrophota bacterium]
MENILSTYSRQIPGRTVSVIVVSCQKEGLLSDCLLSVSRQTHPFVECLVFLNCACQEDLSRWQKRFPAFKFFYFTDNQLYCRPNNEGIRISSGEYVLCLNDDVALSPSYIDEAVKIMEADSAFGMLSGCLFRPDGKTVDSAGLVWSKCRKPHDRGYGMKPSKPYPAGPVFGVNGAAAFYRRKMLEEVKDVGGYFDESYGIYYEDLDLSWRARRMGWKAVFNPASVAIHKRGATTRIEESGLPGFFSRFAFVKLPHDLKVRHVRNRYATMIKNDRLWAFLLDLPWILFYEARLFIYLAFFDRRVLRDLACDTGFFSSAFAKRKGSGNG